MTHPNPANRSPAEPHPIHPLDVILHKRDGLTLSDAEIEAFIHATVRAGHLQTQSKHQPQNQPPQTPAQPGEPTVTDAQIAAFLMAVFQRGLQPSELAALTRAMRFSGETFDAAPLHTFTIDKHSTGGVGDKTSLLLAPILAAAGLAHPTPAGTPGLCVPMISGRSLGHTGGTLDKLETIPGFDTQLSLPRFEQVLRRCGAALIGQTPSLVPADRILYALRDHTGTVESPFLITASIMSKKLAESLNGLVLDVKTGSGAFMKSEHDARFLARLMVETGEAAGTRTVALLTRMDQPLGRFAGNYVEVLECVQILEGARHPMSRDLLHLTRVLAGWMLHLAGQAPTPQAGAALADDLLSSGAARRAWLNLVEAQHGDPRIFDQPERFHQPAARRTLSADASGFLHILDCTEVGWAVQRLGAGRLRPGDPVSPHAGIEIHAKEGDPIQTGQPLLTLFSDDESLLAEPHAMLHRVYTVAPVPPDLPPLIGEVLQATPA